ncbi:MAG: folate-binding protein YgfZ [Rubrivivax sp.]|nr:folate-binding protein YgfZ [Rubrivivax sp.]
MTSHDLLTGHVALTDWGLIRARGEDSRSFLHGQLTQDMLTLAPGETRLAGYCSAKGRLLASFVVWLDGDDVLLACSADLLPATLKRLSMFVLRAKCKLSDATAELPLHGLVGDAVAATAVQRPIARLPDALGLPRALCVGEPPAGSALDGELWRWLEVHSGVARIVGATAEHFVPQMVNLELVGGVNFQKGCYPGQEIVARSQYRGTLKRRAYVVSGDSPLQPGQEIFSPAEPEQPVGEVVLAAAPAGRTPAALVELKIAAAPGPLHAGSATGPALRLGALPYNFPAEAA